MIGPTSRPAETDFAAFIPSLAGGGAERVVVALCNALASKGLRIDLLAGRASGPYVGDVDRALIRLIDLQSSSPATWTWKLARYLRRTRPGTLLSALPHANVAAIIAGKIAGVSTRIAVSEHTTVGEVAGTSRRLLARLLPMALRATYPRADHIIAVSHGVADDLARLVKLPRERIEVIYNPVDLAAVQRGAAQPLDNAWFDDGSPPVILSVGRLISAKDHACLLEAFARIRESRNCRLAILGDGELGELLATQAVRLGIAGDLQMPGFQKNPYAWMRRAAVVVLSSRREGMGLVLVESMACGTPVVSTDCPGGTAEVLEDGKWGRLVPVGDPDAMASAIAATLDDTERPDVEKRAADFGLNRAIDSYANTLGLDL